MAEYGKGVNYTKVLDPSSENIIDPGLIGGKVRVFQDYISIAATNLQSSNYVIFGSKLPTGAQVVDIRVSTDGALGTNSHIVVGDEGDSDRYITSTTVSTGTVAFGPNVAGGMYYSVTGTTDNYIRVAAAAAASIVSGSTLKVSVMYVVE